jgi:hypothetical protein
VQNAAISGEHAAHRHVGELPVRLDAVAQCHGVLTVLYKSLAPLCLVCTKLGSPILAL